MGLISATKRIAVEMLKTMDDATKQNLVLPLNALNEQIVNTVNGQLSFKDNMTSKIGSQTMTDGQMVIIANPLGSARPIGVTDIACSNISGVKHLFITPQANSSQLGLTVFFNVAGVTASVTYLMIGG